MKRKKVLKRKYMPQGLPCGLTLSSAVAMDYWGASEMLWGMWWVVFGLLWIGCITNLLMQDEVGPAELGKEDDIEFLKKIAGK